MSQSQLDDENTYSECCYVYVYFEPRKVGEEGEKVIVPSSAIKKFDFDKYKENKNVYKDKKFKIRMSPEGEKQKCYVMYAADSYHKVSEWIQKGKRVSIPNPKYATTIEDSTSDNNSSAREHVHADLNDNSRQQQEMHERLKASKSEAKNKKKRKENNKEDNYHKILSNYMGQQEDKDDDEEEEQLEDHLSKKRKKKVSSGHFDSDHSEQGSQRQIPLATSSPLNGDSRQNIIRQQRNVIQELEHKLKGARKEVMDMRNERQENVVQNNSNTDWDPFKVHDKIYCYKKEQEERLVQYDDNGNVLLGEMNGEKVYCNPIAYAESFNTMRPSKCLALLWEGVYGLKNLSKRCVREQKNTVHLKPLSPVKKTIIERKVYTFLRSKDFTISQVDHFLNHLNKEHRTVINNAGNRLQYLKKLEEERKRIEAEALANGLLQRNDPEESDPGEAERAGLLQRNDPEESDPHEAEGAGVNK